MRTNRNGSTGLFSALSLDYPTMKSESNSNTFPNYRRSISKRLPTSEKLSQDSSYEHGLMINTSFFDGHLFQAARSSYILDYNETPKDLNRFLDGHRMSPESSQIDAHLFKLSFILTLSEWHTDAERLLDYFPHDENDEQIVNEISHYKRFCFPELNSKGKATSNYLDEQSTYVFTRILSDGQVEYGYCRRIINPSSQRHPFPIVICIVSAFTYFKLYDAILNELTAVYTSNELECSLLIQSFYSKPLPVPTANSSGIVCILNDRRIFFYVCPRDDRLNHDYFFTLISCLSPSNVLILFEAMLHSKRILCFSNSLSKLTKCCLALSLLLYPMVWPYSFVSVMPSSWLRDLLDSPCPYIYGCLHETMSQLPSTIDKDTLRVDLDGNTIDVDCDDQSRLPEDLRQTFQSSLEYLVRFRLVKLNSNLVNIAVSEASLRVFLELFFRLPDFFHRLPSRTSTIQRHDSGIDLQSVDSVRTERQQNDENRFGYQFRSDDFLISQSTSSYVTFLNDFIHGMIFLKFLDDYQRDEETHSTLFSIFSQRLKERRRMTRDELSIPPIQRFRQTLDLLEKQMKIANRSSNPTFSKFVKKFFD